LTKVSNDELARLHLAFDLHFFGRSFDGLPSLGFRPSAMDDVVRAVPHMMLDMFDNAASAPHRSDLEFSALKLATETFGHRVFDGIFPEIFRMICNDSSRFSRVQRDWACDLWRRVAASFDTFVVRPSGDPT
jgi:hypothetical protein